MKIKDFAMHLREQASSREAKEQPEGILLEGGLALVQQAYNNHRDGVEHLQARGTTLVVRDYRY